MAEDLAGIDRLYERLARLDDWREERLAEWTRLYIRVFRRARRVMELYSTASALNESVLAQIAARRRRQIALLGKFIPAFAVPEPPVTAVDRARLTAIQLTLFKLEQFAYYAAFPQLHMDVEHGTGLIAHDLWQLIQAK